ncbi:MAG TPA: M28 family metallopeptidase [Gemmatimonadales bacterium]|nr:M28 family metallopeptidase [Gemmatimonadales bacterium]
MFSRIRRLVPLLLCTWVTVAQAQGSIEARYRATADRLIDAALADSAAYNRLGDLVDTFGHRLSGSASLERAIDWVLAQMNHDGLAARTEPVMVPHWVRGAESAELVEPRPLKLAMLGLGGSVGTPPGGITAPVLVVSSFDELERRAAEAKGKIVLFDEPFTNYGETVRYRVNGANAAARAGAVASLIRTVASYSIHSPHTGVMIYDSTVIRIPHAAITVEDAMMLHRMQNRGQRIVVHLTMGAQMLPDAPSRNVMAEIRGSERPDEVVVLGGHMDSWDVGQGAMDDGGGVVAAWEAVRLMQKLGLHPRRTIRVVGWVNEENGGRGGAAYLAAHTRERHVLAIESDGGVFRPVGFGFTGSDSAMTMVRQIAGLLRRIGADSIEKGGGGSDIEPLMETGVPGLGLNTDGTRYFWFHHSDGDTLDKLDPHEVAMCVATMAVMAYVAADLPDPLPR